MRIDFNPKKDTPQDATELLMVHRERARSLDKRADSIERPIPRSVLRRKADRELAMANLVGKMAGELEEARLYLHNLQSALGSDNPTEAHARALAGGSRWDVPSLRENTYRLAKLYGALLGNDWDATMSANEAFIAAEKALQKALDKPITEPQPMDQRLAELDKRVSLIEAQDERVREARARFKAQYRHPTPLY